MIARPYAVACVALLAGMFAAAALITLYLGAMSAPNLFFRSAMLFFIPAVVVLCGLMGLLVWAIMPRAARPRPAPAATGTVVLACFAAATTVFSFFAGRSLGTLEPRLNLMLAMLGVLMIVTGNVAGKLPFNHAFGFRSMWALADEEIWDKTQRFGGWVMVIAGFVIVDAALIFDLATVNWIMLAATCGSSILITIFSRRFAQQKRKARDEAWQRLAS